MMLLYIQIFMGNSQSPIKMDSIFAHSVECKEASYETHKIKNNNPRSTTEIHQSECFNAATTATLHTCVRPNCVG